MVGISSVCLVLLGIIVVSSVSAQPTNIWMTTWGNTGNDANFFTVVDAAGSGSIYATGCTDGPIGSPTSSMQAANMGSNDWFVLKFSSTSQLLWMRLLQTNNEDVGMSVTTDVLGNVYVCGLTRGYLLDLVPSQPGTRDSVLVRYGSDGTRAWQTNFGSINGDDFCNNVISRQSYLYVTLQVGCCQLLVKQVDASNGYIVQTFSSITTSNNINYASLRLIIDSNNYLYVASAIQGVVPQGLDGNNNAIPAINYPNGWSSVTFVFDAVSGNRITNLVTSTGSGSSGAYDVVVDGVGGVYVIGDVYQPINGQSWTGTDSNVFLIKYSLPNFEVVWTREFGPNYYHGYRLLADGLGGIYAFSVYETTDRNSLYGKSMLSKFDLNGNMIWQYTYGSSGDNRNVINNVGLDGAGNLVVSGTYNGNFDGNPSINYNPDGFIYKQQLPYNCSCSNLQSLVQEVQQLLNIAPAF